MDPLGRPRVGFLAALAARRALAAAEVARGGRPRFAGAGLSSSTSSSSSSSSSAFSDSGSASGALRLRLIGVDLAVALALFGVRAGFAETTGVPDADRDGLPRFLGPESAGRTGSSSMSTSATGAGCMSSLRSRSASLSKATTVGPEPLPTSPVGLPCAIGPLGSRELWDRLVEIEKAWYVGRDINVKKLYCFKAQGGVEGPLVKQSRVLAK